MKEEFITQSIIRLNENTPRIAKCLQLLSNEELWYKPNKSSNSIANLILHLCGNMSQYIHSGLGGSPDLRSRDMEFSTSSGYDKDQLLTKLTQCVSKAEQILTKCSLETLQKVRTVQGFRLSGLAMVLHVVEHYSYHTGQIALLTKIMKNQDLGFYAGQDLNAHNKQ